MYIDKFLKTDLETGGSVTALDTATDGNLYGDPDRGEGLVHDDSGNLYHINRVIFESAIHRVGEAFMTLDLTITPGSAPDNFSNPTFATIIGGAAPPVPAPPYIFGNIIW